MPVPGLTEDSIASYRVGTGQLITAPSYLIDRFVPECEVVCLPDKTVAGGVLRYGRGALPKRPAPKGLKARLSGPRPLRPAPPNRSVIDLRRRDPQNWAHFLNNHLPMVIRLCDRLGVPWDRVLLILPADTPGYIAAGAALFGFEILATDDDIEGDGILFDADPWTAIRPERAEWVQGARVRAALDPALTTTPALPARVFLPRRGTRNLENQTEIEIWLARFGFVSLYPEDLSAADQMRLFHQAEVIVAVHGAGLAPLLYRQPDSRLRQLVEILPCGHMTDVYRVMAQQVGVAWIGVRGRIKPEYVLPAYEFDKAFRDYSLDAFTLDIAALEQAFALAQYPVTEHAHG